MTKRIEDYALIGDCETAALVRKNGCIEWLCWPRFDSGAIFAALLGNDENGCWKLASTDKDAKTSRRYRAGTLVLETTVETANGSVCVIDFMPLRDRGTSHLVRIIRGERGTVEMETELVFRFDYGLIVPWVTRLDGGLKAVAGPNMAALRTNAPIHAEGFKHCGRFPVAAGETVYFVLSYADSFGEAPPPIDPMKALDETARRWEQWSKQWQGEHPYSDAVLRSLITLKALTYCKTGGIVAAPTTSLPEEIGGERNWDYRLCWLRDATFTLLALLNSGFRNEAVAWRLWLQRAVAGSPQQMQIVYGLAGERWVIESEAPWLPGFEGSKPVRIGNAASNQLQIDVYGEVMDAFYQGSIAGLYPHHEAWPFQCNLLDHLEQIWHQPDEGIWEVRGGARQFTNSKVQAWVSFDRAIKLVERFGLDGPAARWRQLCGEIRKQVCEAGYNGKIKSFVQSYGAKELDASALLMPLLGFLPPEDPRIKSTLEAIGTRLRDGKLIRRYETSSGADGLKGGEGTFLACSFWYADNLILQGRREEARELFEYLLTLRNDVGLLSEECDGASGQLLGNFPQAFSHVALINTAHNLEGWQKPAEQRGGAG